MTNNNNKDTFFEIPVVLMTFLRTDGALRIIDRIRQVRPKKIILLSDGPRNEREKAIIDDLRLKIVSAIDWGAEIVRVFPDKNQGVFCNIGLGAKQVFQTEKWAIFLEDDNLPDVSFFRYCEYMLRKYEKNQKIFWVCGTNYLGRSNPVDGSDYYFTQHLLPCGWASWSEKFLKYYDSDFSLAKSKTNIRLVKKTYFSKSLFRQQMESIRREMYRKEHFGKYISWDYQTIFSIRANNLLGISPRVNLITNFGTDLISTHLKVRKHDSNVSKFCNVPSYSFPVEIKDPTLIQVEKEYETKVSKIILAPILVRIATPLLSLERKILGVYPDGKKQRK